MLVDYFVELSNVTRNISTLEIKGMFHKALLSAMELDPIIDEYDDVFEPTPKTKETYLLGHFKLDPVSTDFIGKSSFTTVKR